MARRLAPALAVVAALWWTAAVAAIDLAAYHGLAREALVLVESGDVAAAREAGRRLDAVGAVVLPNGATIEPENDAIVQALAAEPPDLATAANRLELLIEEIERQEITAPEQADANLRRVLDRAEFQPPAPNPVTELLTEWIRPLWDWIASWFPESEDEVETETTITDANTPIGVVGALLLLGFVLALIAGMQRSVGRRVTRAETAPAAAARQIGWEEMAREAQRAAGQGQFREAIRLLYIATLLRGDEAGLLQFDRAMTNRELLAQVRARGESPQAARIAPLIERFDALWYGGEGGSDSTYAEFARQSDAVWTPSA